MKAQANFEKKIEGKVPAISHFAFFSTFFYLIAYSKLTEKSFEP